MKGPTCAGARSIDFKWSTVRDNYSTVIEKNLSLADKCVPIKIMDVLLIEAAIYMGCTVLPKNIIGYMLLAIDLLIKEIVWRSTTTLLITDVNITAMLGL